MLKASQLKTENAHAECHSYQNSLAILRQLPDCFIRVDKMKVSKRLGDKWEWYVLGGSFHTR